MSVAITAEYDPFALTDAAFGEDSDDMLAEVIDIATARVKATPARVARCLGCGRILRSAKSIARGRGRHCYRRALAAAVTLDGSFSDQQIENAIEAIEDGAVIPAETPGLVLVVSSKGDENYETDGARCTCPAGENGRCCWHLAAYALAAA